MRSWLILLCFLPIGVLAQETKPLTKDMKQLFADGYADKSLSNYAFSDPTQWMITKNGQSGKDMKCLGGQLKGSRAYAPIEVAFLNGVELADFVMEFDFLQRGKDFSLRDLCVVYAFADSLNYNFVQAASEEDKNTHNVFSVQNGTRPRKIGTTHNQGVVWGYEKWHQITIVRQTAEKSLKLFVDGELVVESTNDVDRSGKIGIGTFGSEFKIDNLEVWGKLK